MFCSGCKCCVAQDGFDLCVFCEDGVLCPNQKKRALQSALVTATSPISKIGAKAVHAATVRTTTESEPRSNEEGRSQDGRSPAAPSHPWRAFRSIIGKPPAADPAPQGAIQVSPVRERRYSGPAKCTERTERTNTSSKEKPMSMKKCRHPQCETLIMEHNKSGCCGKHFHWGTKNPADGSASSAKRGRPRKDASANGKAKASPPRNSVTSKSDNGTSQAIATICITEAHLDYFWQKLSLDEKAEIFTNQLRS